MRGLLDGLAESALAGAPVAEDQKIAPCGQGMSQARAHLGSFLTESNGNISRQIYRQMQIQLAGRILT